MRIRRVTAHAFGPLTGATLEFAEGLTVVYGPNESAKSTWHAALTAALCGLKRGARSVEDREFERRHQPWDGGGWEVSAEVVLGDGRRVELRHDLAGGVIAYAKDLATGVDYANEITASQRNEVPDASRWLGLDRRTFRATASVAQAQVAAVAEQADALREHLQRAAATAGADETAAVALTRIDDHRREHVGSTKVNATGPLRRAMTEAQATQEALAVARRDHAEYEARSVAVQRLRFAAAEARRRVRAREAVLAQATAAAWHVKAAEARQLARLLAVPDDVAVPVPGSAEDAALVADVAAALAAWRALPRAREPSSAALPRGASADDLRDVARVLEQAAVPASTGSALDRADSGPIAEATAQVRWLARRRRRALAVAGFGVLILAAGMIAMLAGRTVPGALVAAAGAAIVLSGLWRQVAAHGAKALAAARTDLEQARIDEAAQGRLLAAVQSEVAAARAWCAERGLPADPTALRALAAEHAGQERDERWRRGMAEARERVAEQAGAVAGRANLPAGPVDETVARLEEWLAAEPERSARRAEHRDRHVRLAHLLDGATLSELHIRADDAARQAETAARLAEQARRDADRLAGEQDSAEPRTGDFGAAEPGDRPPGEGRQADEAALRREYDEAVEVATRAEAALAAWSRGLPSVAEAEERARAAAAELARVRDLDRILGLAREFLVRAQDRVHRDIAPRLAAAVSRDLAAVTDGRYQEVIIDPGSLAVQVRGAGGRLRDAGGLSYGTKEQVYLLVRVALAEHLVRSEESCPLLLDDVTVHADAARTDQILRLLLAVAERHQVVLFSQQEQVRRWAAELRDPRHALRELTPVPVC